MLGAGLLVVSALVVFYTFESSQRVVLQYATESAREHAESVTQFRNFYAQELVPRAVRAGVSVTHDYKSTDNALPLPATLTIDLGHYLSKVDGGTQVRLYSDLPFPWRVDERELDDFQKQALLHLKQRPEEPFVREEVMKASACCAMPRPIACCLAVWLVTTITKDLRKPIGRWAMSVVR